MAKKDYDEKKLTKTLDKFTDKQLLAFWNMLTELPDPDDDPFS